MVPRLSGKIGRKLIEMAMHSLRLDAVNALYDRNAACKGAEFAKALFDDQGISLKIGNPRRLLSLPQGAFITVSNHPYGHIDGIALIDIFAHLRPDFKVMVNSIISRIKTLEENLITVVPTGRERTAPKTESINGVREVLNSIRSGSPVGFFPSGAVSDLSIRDKCIRDRQWQEPALKLIRKAEVPVIPVRFFDRSSNFYYLLGLISSSVRLLRLPSEVLNKGGQAIRIGIGETIPVERQRECGSLEEFGTMLRESVYSMPLPEEWKII